MVFKPYLIGNFLIRDLSTISNPENDVRQRSEENIIYCIEYQAPNDNAETFKPLLKKLWLVMITMSRRLLSTCYQGDDTPYAAENDCGVLKPGHGAWRLHGKGAGGPL